MCFTDMVKHFPIDFTVILFLYIQTLLVPQHTMFLLVKGEFVILKGHIPFFCIKAVSVVCSRNGKTPLRLVSLDYYWA